MIKDITFTGLTTSPSDYESPDGALALSLNLISEDGHLMPIPQPKTLIQFQPRQAVVGLHRTQQYAHYIVHDAGTHTLYWMPAQASGLVTDAAHTIGTFPSFGSVQCIGNTLLVLSADELRYILFKQDRYISLGSHLPHVELSFGLKGTPCFYSLLNEDKSKFKITFDKIDVKDLYSPFSEQNKTKITQQVMAKVNRFLRQQTIDKGRFALPFMLRYALRLYDGSLVCHSAPILLTPSTDGPVVLLTDVDAELNGRDYYYKGATCDIMIVPSTINYRLITGTDLSLWADIVKSIDVFISAPIYTYDQDGQCTSFSSQDVFASKFIGQLCPQGFSDSVKADHILLPLTINGQPVAKDTDPSQTGLHDTYAEWTYNQIYSLYMDPKRQRHTDSVAMPRFSQQKIQESIRGTGNFFFLQSISPSRLSTTQRTDITIPAEYLQSLLTREAMTDDYLSNDRLIAGYAHAYNSRINLAGVSRQLFHGFKPSSMFAYCNTWHLMWQQPAGGSPLKLRIDKQLTQIHATVYINEGGSSHVVWCTDTMLLSPILSKRVYPTEEAEQQGVRGYFDRRSWACYVFYPNPNAYKLVLTDSSGTYSYDLQPHPLLNAAYCLIDFEQQRLNRTDAHPEGPHSQSAIISVANKIYTSEVDNPFLFRPTGINTVGTGTILGITSATKALSQGQFGQFPLYAFTTQGVWALEVSPTGTYAAKQPVTRDACINPSSITQLDNAVLFATDRGIMLIAGSEATCITDAISSPAPFNLLTLPAMDKLHALAGHKADTCLPTAPFLTFMEQCRMAYDYTHQHIIVYNPHYTYAYVYSLRSRQWGMMNACFASTINAYPDALAMTTDHRLVSFSQHESQMPAGIFVSRPIKLQSPDVLKTAHTCILRGMFRSPQLSTMCWASRDMYTWFLLGTSVSHYLRGMHGTPYKYFRIAGIAALQPDMSIHGATLQYVEKFNNRPR